MSDKNALDLSSIDPPIWRVIVEDVVYGPYTLGQMKVFVAEGRLLGSSKVAQGDGGAFTFADQHVDLKSLFADDAAPAAPDGQPEASNYLVTLQTDGDGRRAAISLFNEIGRFAELMPGSCFLNATISVTALREILSSVLAERGRFVMAIASSGQLAWMGLKDEAGGYAKTVWKRDP